MIDPGATAATEEIVVHKFRALTDYFWDSLERSALYFAAPDQLNDPYDCRIDLLKAFELARGSGELDIWHPHATKIMQISATTGVLSFSTGDLTDSGLMWSHYAANHSGVCLTFKIPQDFVVNCLVGQAPVRYGEDALLAAIRALNIEKCTDFATLEPVIKAYLTTKASSWAYEEEGRLIAFEPGAMTVPREYLQQVCYGLRTTEADRLKVSSALVAHGYYLCKEVELIHSPHGLFALELRELPDR